MGKSRVVSTKFWKDKKVLTLTSEEKLIYLYLITNEHTALCGCYQTTVNEMAHDTGLSVDRVSEAMILFESLSIAYLYNDEWVIIPKYSKHQNMNNPKVKAGIKHDLLTIPEDVIAYRESIDRVRATLTSTPTPTEDKKRPLAMKSPSKTIAPLKDELAARWEKAFTDKVPMSAWGDIGRGRRDCGLLAKKLRALSKDTEIEERELASSLIAAFMALKRKGKSDFWKTATFTPTGFVARWAAVVDEVAKDNAKPEMEESTRRFLEGVYDKRK